MDVPNDLKVFSSRCKFDLFTNNPKKTTRYDDQTFQNQSKQGNTHYNNVKKEDIKINKNDVKD